MRIAMIGQKGMPAVFGGVERHVHELSMRLVRRGHDVTVYSSPWYSRKKVKNIQGVRLRFIPSIHTKHLDTISHVFLATIDAMRRGFDVLHYHGVGPALLSWIPRVFSPQTTVIVTFHSIDRKHEKWGWFARLALKLGERAACRFPHETIAVSRTIQQYCRDVYDREALFIPNGVPAYARTKETGMLKKWKLKSGAYLLIVSRLIPSKGIQYAIAAYQNLRETQPHLVHDTPLVIVGSGFYTDRYVRGLKSMAAGDPNIIFTGFQSSDALAQLFAHARLAIHPSDIEGLSITVLEEMSYGLPVLVSDIPEHRELVSAPRYNFAHGDSDDFATMLAGLLGKHRAELAKQGVRNRALVRRL